MKQAAYLDILLLQIIAAKRFQQINAFWRDNPSDVHFMKRCLKAWGKPVGVLFNFGSAKLEWKRMILTHPTIRVHSCSLAVKAHGETANEHQ